MQQGMIIEFLDSELLCLKCELVPVIGLICGDSLL